MEDSKKFDPFPSKMSMGKIVIISCDEQAVQSRLKIHY